MEPPGFVDLPPAPPEAAPDWEAFHDGPEVDGDPVPGVCWVCGGRVEDVRTAFEPYVANAFDPTAPGVGPGPHAHCAARAERIEAGLRHRPSGWVDVRTAAW